MLVALKNTLALQLPQTDLSLEVYEKDSSRRPEVESFVREIYAARYGATVKEFAPILLALRNEEGLIVAAVGYRYASAAPLFLERYLDAPVEQLLFGASPSLSHRSSIVEVAHLASLKPGEGRHIMRLLGQHLTQLGMQWVISTVTRELRHLFLRMGIAPLALGRADASRLGVGANDWGSYYAHDPVVLAVALSQTTSLQPRLVAGA